MKTYVSAIAAALLWIACEETHRTEEGNGGGDGDSDADPDQEVGTDGCESLLTAIVRDFPNGHPDFYHDGSGVATLGMVDPDLDGEEKPISASGEMYSANLDQWYRTESGVNMEFSREIELTKDTAASSFVFDTSEYFPLDIDEGYGNDIPEYPERNWLFTTELKLNFVYENGQNFTFRGDDDLWVFINGRLAIDVGGIHSPVEASFKIDDFNTDNAMGMVPGQMYPMHIFHAERNPTQSNFRIETNIGCFSSILI